MPRLSPEVTAVITTHARPAAIQTALASVCTETCRDLECVIVDDGGTFEPRAVDSDTEIRVVRGRSLGVAAARNLGLAAARGRFIIFLDDDDVALPNRIATLLETAVRFDADLCYGLTRRVVAGDSSSHPHVPTGLLSSGAAGFCDLLTCAPHVNSVLVRTAALRDIGGFDVEARHFDDWSAWLRLADQNATMRCVPEVVAEWRIHGQGLSAEILELRAMKSRLLALFDRLAGQLSNEGARSAASARRLVESSDIVTYDDYADAMTAARTTLHDAGTCFGQQPCAHRSSAGRRDGAVFLLDDPVFCDG